MGDEKKTTKMIQVHRTVYRKLLVKKHELESKSEGSLSFSSVVGYLLENQRDK